MVMRPMEICRRVVSVREEEQKTDGHLPFMGEADTPGGRCGPRESDRLAG
jgi:hypothetical protein